MSLQPDPTAAEAFERLRTEVALLRRAVEGVAADVGGEAVDYSPTLAALSEAIEAASAKVTALCEKPVMALAPEQLAVLMQAASARVLAKPLAELERSRATLGHATEAIQATRKSEAARARSWRRTAALLGGGALVGAVVWGTLLGPVARRMPSAWNVPERLAAASLGLPMAPAGERLLGRSDPVAWDALQMVRSLPRSQMVALRQCLSLPAGQRAKLCTLKLRDE
jgi:hypothetical protein